MAAVANGREKWHGMELGAWCAQQGLQQRMSSPTFLLFLFLSLASAMGADDLASLRRQELFHSEERLWK